MDKENDEFEHIRDAINDKALLAKLYEKVEDLSGDSIEGYLSALAAIVLLNPEYGNELEKKDRLFEVGKNLFVDSISEDIQLPFQYSNAMFLALYMKVIFPIKFIKVLKTCKKSAQEMIAEIIMERRERLPFEAMEIATPLKILEPYLMNKREYEIQSRTVLD